MLTTSHPVFCRLPLLAPMATALAASLILTPAARGAARTASPGGPAAAPANARSKARPPARRTGERSAKKADARRAGARPGQTVEAQPASPPRHGRRMPASRPQDARASSGQTSRQAGRNAQAGRAARGVEQERSGGRAPQPNRGRTDKEAKRRDRTWKRIARFLGFFHPSTLWYLQYRYGDKGGTDGAYNRFFVGRGYITLKFKPTRWFEGRATLDTHQDEHGDWKIRLKYMYGKFKLPMETRFVTEPFVEFGIVHMPWLDYEEHTNYYRVQGTMFSERNKLHSSADVGLTLGTLIGRKLPRKVSSAMHDKYPGSWGSLALGVYNGAGYHGIEENTNKVVEGRISLRPAGPYFPYLQLSYFFTYGKGAQPLVLEDDPNTPQDESFTGAPPTWQSNIAMLSFTHPYGVLTAQYAFGTGCQKGDESGWLYSPGDPDGPAGEARSYRGASVFAEARLPWIRSSLWGRYDWWDGPYAGGTDPYHRFIAGYAYHFWGRNQNLLLLDFEYLLFDAPGDTRENQWALTLSAQIHLK